MRGLCVLALLAMIAPLPLAAQTDYPPEVLEAYWRCTERHDLDAIKDLLWHHHEIERIDASVYGLPQDDLDDRSLLTIDERLQFRAGQQGGEVPMATSGPLQYPHFLRRAYDARYAAEGGRPDCSAILEGSGVEPPPHEDLGPGWASDLNVTSHDTRPRGEVDIIVDRADPSRVFTSSCPATWGENSNFYAASEDHGQTWRKGRVGNTSGTVWSCDPVSYYGAATNDLYHGMISCTTYTCDNYQVRMRRSENNGVSWTDCARPGNQTKEDRLWIVADNNPESACYGNVYSTWHNLNRQTVARSTDQCATWVNRTGLTGYYQAITPDINVAADGHVYAVWQNQGDATFKIAGSNDCGATWASPARLTVKTRLGQWKNNIPAQCQRGISTQPSVDVDRAPQSTFFGRVYMTMFDFNRAGCGSGPGCNTWSTDCNYEVWFTYSDDEGQTWATPVNLTAGDGNMVDNFMGYMRVDQADGSIYVGYHRTRLNPTSLQDRQKTHFFVTRSTDGGATWETPLQASTLEGDERLSGADGFERGDYNRVDVHDGVMWPVWVDRRGTTAEEEIVTRKICSEPTHWSERAPTFAAPEITVGDAGNQTFNVSWELPDVYWGDGGEDPDARHFELWVDGGLVEDDILWTATSTTYAAPDCSSRTFVVRAVNQCGLSKDYASASASCCDDNPGVDVTPDGPLTLCDGTGQTLTANLSGGSGPFDHQWYQDGALIPGATATTYAANDGGTHVYNCEVMGDTCAEASSDPAATQIVWQLEPSFAGLDSVVVSDPNECAMDLGWSAASSACPGPFTYNVYRSTTPGFTPDAGNRIATGLSSTTYTDATTEFEIDYYYVVRSVDQSNGAEDGNTVERSANCGQNVLFGDSFESGDTTVWARTTP